jgi:hypothetical protein
MGVSGRVAALGAGRLGGEEQGGRASAGEAFSAGPAAERAGALRAHPDQRRRAAAMAGHGEREDIAALALRRPPVAAGPERHRCEGQEREHMWGNPGWKVGMLFHPSAWIRRNPICIQQSYRAAFVPRLGSPASGPKAPYFTRRREGREGAGEALKFMPISNSLRLRVFARNHSCRRSGNGFELGVVPPEQLERP